MFLHSTSTHWQDQLISLYLWFDHMLFERGYACFAQRFSNHRDPAFDDAQLLAAHFFARAQGIVTHKKCWLFVTQFLSDWFPLLPNYSGYIDRLNRLEGLLPSLIDTLLEVPRLDTSHVSLVMDSCPIVMAGAKRAKRAKVAPELQGCGYCAARQMYDGGLKLHLVAVRRPGQMPYPVAMSVSPANHPDIEALRQIQDHLPCGDMYADKAYDSKE